MTKSEMDKIRNNVRRLTVENPTPAVVANVMEIFDEMEAIFEETSGDDISAEAQATALDAICQLFHDIDDLVTLELGPA